MNPDIPFRRAQVYRFLAGALVYPAENWLEDLPDVAPILRGLDFSFSLPDLSFVDLQALQKAYRLTIGLSGSLPYETEIGLPNEFRQSQEMADIAGFYRAFGFSVGGAVRERADHLATELEFMCILALKQTYAASRGEAEREEICQQAQCSFLGDHLGRWIGLFAEGLASLMIRSGQDDPAQNPYLWLARLGADFVEADARRLGVSLTRPQLQSVAPTPLSPELFCESCPAAAVIDRQPDA